MQREADRAEYLRRVAAVRARFEAARPTKSPAVLQQVRAEYDRLPAVAPGVETDGDAIAREALGREITAAVVGVITDLEVQEATRRWLRTQEDIGRALKRFDVPTAAADLRASDVRLPAADAYRKDGFSAAVQDAAEVRVRAAREKRETAEALRAFEAAAKDAGVIGAVSPAALEHVRGLTLALRRDRDRELYDDFRYARTRPTAEVYLRDGPTGRMAATAMAFLAWDDDRRRDQPLKVVARVDCKNWADAAATGSRSG